MPVQPRRHIIITKRSQRYVPPSRISSEQKNKTKTSPKTSTARIKVSLTKMFPKTANQNYPKPITLPQSKYQNFFQFQKKQKNPEHVKHEKVPLMIESNLGASGIVWVIFALLCAILKFFTSERKIDPDNPEKTKKELAEYIKKQMKRFMKMVGLYHLSQEDINTAISFGLLNFKTNNVQEGSKIYDVVGLLQDAIYNAFEPDDQSSVTIADKLIDYVWVAYQNNPETFKEISAPEINQAFSFITDSLTPFKLHLQENNNENVSPQDNPTNMFLIKPVDINDLVARIENIRQEVESLSLQFGTDHKWSKGLFGKDVIRIGSSLYHPDFVFFPLIIDKRIAEEKRIKYIPNDQPIDDQTKIENYAKK